MNGRFQLTRDGSNAISIIRMLACFSIVTCHFLQAYNNDWAFVLNVGVQIFLIISGFLYGIFGIKDIKQFYTKRFKKIYFPYFIWTCIIAVLLLIFVPISFNYNDLLKQIFLVGFMPGQNHLWFMEVLFGCYIIVPLFELIKNRQKALYAFLSWLALLLILYTYTHNPKFLWGALYFIGYGMGRFSKFIMGLGALSLATFVVCSVNSSVSTYRWGGGSWQYSTCHISSHIVY